MSGSSCPIISFVFFCPQLRNIRTCANLSNFPLKSQDKPARQRENNRKQNNRKHKIKGRHEVPITEEGFRGNGKVSPFHHLGDKTGDGGGRLVWVQLCEQVAHVVGCASLFPCHKTKQPGGIEEKDASKLKLNRNQC